MHTIQSIGNDQVCSYRCIVSYESEQFENFAKCILQRHNCMKNTAVAPIYPDPQPLSMFRNEALTHDLAEGNKRKRHASLLPSPSLTLTKPKKKLT